MIEIGNVEMEEVAGGRIGGTSPYLPGFLDPMPSPVAPFPQFPPSPMPSPGPIRPYFGGD